MPKEGIENGGSEIKIIVQKKLKSNVFPLPIEGAKDLDFFDQPKLSAKEIAEDTVRLESIIGSNAAYSKPKANHRVGIRSMPPGRAVTSIDRTLRCPETFGFRR